MAQNQTCKKRNEKKGTFQKNGRSVASGVIFLGSTRPLILIFSAVRQKRTFVQSATKLCKKWWVAPFRARLQTICFAPNGNFVILLCLYPIYGFVEQFLIQSMVARNLSYIHIPPIRHRHSHRHGHMVERGKVRLAVISLIVACCFAIVHFPRVILMFATFSMGLFFTPIYLKWKCLWPLGVFHGWMGACIYFFIFNEDPWEANFG